MFRSKQDARDVARSIERHLPQIASDARRKVDPVGWLRDHLMNVDAYCRSNPWPQSGWQS